MTWYVVIDCGSFDQPVNQFRTEVGAYTFRDKTQEISVIPLLVKEKYRILSIRSVPEEICISVDVEDMNKWDN